jgi:hypothetical protein
MTRLSAYILLLALFLLAACNGEKEFMTPKTGEVVLDINAEEFSLNGKVLGKTATDISAGDDLLIESLDNELRRIRDLEQEEALKKNQPPDENVIAKVHIDEELSYGIFYKVISTLGFSGYTSIQYVIGSNFKEPLAMDLPERSQLSFSEDHVDPFRCSQARSRKAIGELLERRHHKNNLAVEIVARRVKDTELLIECARRYIDLSLTLNSNEDFSYVVSLNETGLIDGSKFYTYQNLDDVWKLIENLRLRRELQDKEDRDQVRMVLEKDMLIKNLVPVVKKLKALGYKVHLAFING